MFRDFKKEIHFSGDVAHYKKIYIYRKYFTQFEELF